MEGGTGRRNEGWEIGGFEIVGFLYREALGLPFTPFMSSTCANAVCASLGSAERMTEADMGRGRSAGWWSSGMGASGGVVVDAIVMGKFSVTGDGGRLRWWRG